MREISSAPLITWSRDFRPCPSRSARPGTSLPHSLTAIRPASDAVLCLSELVTNACLHSRSRQARRPVHRPHPDLRAPAARGGQRPGWLMGHPRQRRSRAERARITDRQPAHPCLGADRKPQHWLDHMVRDRRPAGPAHPAANIPGREPALDHRHRRPPATALTPPAQPVPGRTSRQGRHQPVHRRQAGTPPLHHLPLANPRPPRRHPRPATRRPHPRRARTPSPGKTPLITRSYWHRVDDARVRPSASVAAR